MTTEYHLEVPIHAILEPGGGDVSVTLPADAILVRPRPASSKAVTNSSPHGGVCWQGRDYSVALDVLLKNTERVSVVHFLDQE